MSEKKKYIDFETYERVAEPHKRERVSAWRTAIGLQDVDGLRVSDYLKEIAVKHIEGNITIDEVREQNNPIIIYQSEDGNTRIEVKFENETVWLTQQQLCDLYQTSKSNISEHIKHIFDEGELDENAVVRNFRTTAESYKV